VSASKVGGAVRIVLGLLYPRRLQKTYHVAGGGCRNRACQVRSWGFEEAGLDLETGGRLDRLHIRVHLRWVSRWARRLLVVTGDRCPLTKPVVTAVEQQATTEPHCSRGGGIYVYVVQRGPTPPKNSPPPRKTTCLSHVLFLEGLMALCAGQTPPAGGGGASASLWLTATPSHRPGWVLDGPAHWLGLLSAAHAGLAIKISWF
jgi:hypothetical protein